MQECSDEKITQDRLGLKLMLMKGDTSCDDLHALFIKLRGVEDKILSEIDINYKGTIERDELMSIAEEVIDDEYFMNLFTGLAKYCENKNEEKIYYSPLFNLMPPYYKYARRLDSLSVIQFMEKKLESCDDYDTGFIPTSIFNTILQSEIKMKDKIIKDLHTGTNDLDLNVQTHTLKLNADYIVLIRRLMGYLQHWGIIEPKPQKVEKTKPI